MGQIKTFCFYISDLFIDFVEIIVPISLQMCSEGSNSFPLPFCAYIFEVATEAVLFAKCVRYTCLFSLCCKFHYYTNSVKGLQLWQKLLQVMNGNNMKLWP